MAAHARHVLTKPGEVRVQVKFRRRDLLWVHRGPLENPHAARLANVQGTVLSVPCLPLATEGGALVGPTILDMLVRDLVPLARLPAALAARATALGKARHGEVPDAWPAWSIRNPGSLWPAPGTSGRSTPRKEAAEERTPDHPFRASLASGGIPAPGSPDGWAMVEKATTVSLAEHAYRLAVGMHGSVSAAYGAIAAMAAVAWDTDRDRALALWSLVGEAPGGLLLEDSEVEALRPGSSVSQEIEREIMRAACKWLGVDPDLDVHRPRGRPRAPAGDEGEVIRVRVDGDGTVTGVFKRAYHGAAEGAALSSLGVVDLAEILGALRQDDLGTDADLLEAYLDAAAADWREQAAAAVGAPAGDASAAETPHDVLGVLADTPMADVAAAFRAQMQAVQHLPNTAPARRLIAAFRAVKQQRGEPT